MSDNTKENISSQFRTLTDFLQDIIDKEETGGISCLLYHEGQIIYQKAFGWKDRSKQERMQLDSIHRIYSMTKPILCVAVLILYEEGKLDLNDPISKYLPEFRESEIITSYDEDTDTFMTNKTTKQITIKHLLTHTSGLSYGFWPDVPLDRLYCKKLKVDTSIPVFPMLEKFFEINSVEDFSREISKFPLAFEPGTHYWYGFNYDILGLLIEKVTEKKLDEFLKDKIFDKLGMSDTDFYVNERKKHRLAKAYTKDKDDCLIEIEGPVSHGFYQKPKFLSGGVGLVSTLEDYLHFCKMLLNSGQSEDVRILEADTVKLITKNHFPNNNSFRENRFIKMTEPEMIEWDLEHGMGLGVAVKIKHKTTKKAIGSHFWEGVLNTIYWIDPENELIFILLTQFFLPDLYPPFDLNELENLVYAALEI